MTYRTGIWEEYADNEVEGGMDNGQEVDEIHNLFPDPLLARSLRLPCVPCPYWLLAVPNSRFPAVPHLSIATACSPNLEPAVRGDRDALEVHPFQPVEGHQDPAAHF